MMSWVADMETVLEQAQEEISDLTPGISAGQFYVYVLLRPDESPTSPGPNDEFLGCDLGNWIPFYIGVSGNPSRIFQHEIEARNGNTSHKSRVIRKVWDQDREILRRIVFRSPNRLLAEEQEAWLIRLYSLEYLTNHTPGGEHTGGPTLFTFREIKPGVKYSKNIDGQLRETKGRR